jgi:hypothetical protein
MRYNIAVSGIAPSISLHFAKKKKKRKKEPIHPNCATGCDLKYDSLITEYTISIDYGGVA